MAAKKKKSPSKPTKKPTKKATQVKPKKATKKPSKAPKKSVAKKASKPASKRLAARPKRTTKRPAPRPKPPRAVKPVKTAVPENPEALALVKELAHLALDKKAQDVTIIDTRRRGSAVGYDYLLLATGESDRQLGAITDGFNEVLKPRGRRPTSVEASPDWVLVNYDDVVAHLFTPDARNTYDLEGLWGDAPRVPVEQ